MKVTKKEVSSKGKVVGTVEVEQAECMADLMQLIETHGEKEIIDLVNSQMLTNAMNKMRAEKSGKPTREALLNKAYALMTAEELQDVAGNPSGMAELIERKVAQVKAELGFDS